MRQEYRKEGKYIPISVNEVINPMYVFVCFLIKPKDRFKDFIASPNDKILNLTSLDLFFRQEH